MSNNSFSLLFITTLCHILIMEHQEKDEYFTVNEFAKIMKLSAETIRRAIREGKVAAVKFNDSKNGSWRISKHEFDRMTSNYNLKYGENCGLDTSFNNRRF